MPSPPSLPRLLPLTIEMWKGLMVIESVLSAFFFTPAACIRFIVCPYCFCSLLAIPNASIASLGVRFIFIYIIYLSHSYFHSHISHFAQKKITICLSCALCAWAVRTRHQSTQYIIETMTTHYFHHFWLTVAVLLLPIRVRKWKRNKSLFFLSHFERNKINRKWKGAKEVLCTNCTSVLHAYEYENWSGRQQRIHAATAAAAALERTRTKCARKKDERNQKQIRLFIYKWKKQTGDLVPSASGCRESTVCLWLNVCECVRMSARHERRKIAGVDRSRGSRQWTRWRRRRRSNTMKEEEEKTSESIHYYQ